MTKINRILRYLCNYIIDNQIKLNDPEEDDYGQCVSTIELSKVLTGTDIDVTQLTVAELSVIALSFDFQVYQDNDEETDNYYGTIHHFQLHIGENDVVIDIWDGF